MMYNKSIISVINKWQLLNIRLFLMTSKKQENGTIESKVGLYKGQFTRIICQLNVSCGQDSVSGIVLFRTRNLGQIGVNWPY
jgi:hypothetical protein